MAKCRTEQNILGVNVPPMASPLTVLWTLWPKDTWVLKPWLQHRANSLPPNHPKRVQNYLSMGPNWFTDSMGMGVKISGKRLRGKVLQFTGYRVSALCCQVLVVRKSLKCSICGSQVRMMQTMLVISFCCFYLCWFQSLMFLFYVHAEYSVFFFFHVFS